MRVRQQNRPARREISQEIERLRREAARQRTELERARVRQMRAPELAPQARPFKGGASVALPDGDLEPPPVSRGDVLTVRGIRVRTYGAVDAATEELSRLINDTVLRPDILERIGRANIIAVIVPADRRLTDLPEFAHLRGKETFDGRPFENVRGVATYGRDGRYYIAIPEENLAQLPSNRHGQYSVGTHEIGHALFEHGISAGERRAINRHFYEGRDRTGFVTNYASSNPHEYFAECVTAFMGRHPHIGDRNGPEWLRENDPRMYTMLARILSEEPLPRRLPRRDG